MVKLLQNSKKVFNFSWVIASIVAAYPVSSVYANNVTYKGIQYGSSEDPFSLQIKGALKLDQRLFLGKTYNVFHNGALIRELSLNFDGSFGKDISVALGLGFDPIESTVSVDDAYITYKGFKGFGDNFQISIGKVNPTFCLENHSSGKWIPFLEKSSVTTTFRPDPGLGFSINKWQNDYSLNASITQPKSNYKLLDADGNKVTKSDRFQYNARVTKAYLWKSNQLIQAGVFGNYNNDQGLGIEFSTSPELRTRNSTSELLNTTKDTPNKVNSRIKSKNHYTVGAEILAQNGPFSVDLEYQFTKVNRDKTQAPDNLKFKGYRSNFNYVLTGESRIFRSSDGTLGQVIPESPSGAWEISGRYDYLNLNNKDIIGGRAHHMGVAATWYANYNFSTTIEYVRSKINKRETLERLNVNTVGARLQLVF